MKKLSTLGFLCFLLVYGWAQTSGTVTPQSQYGRVYAILNTKCQNATCHSATSTGDNLKFDGDSDAVYHQIFNRPSQLFPSSIAKYEELAFPQQPYQSFLLRKIAGSKFDTDLALDSVGEGNLMTPVTPGDTLTNTEIEVVRQWLRFGAKETYANTDAQPDYGTIWHYYNDSVITPFFHKPPKPQLGHGTQLRMGPVFLPTSGPFQEQEYCEQQIMNFPYLAQVTRISGYMNAQSHHFLLFAYADSTAARSPSSSNVAPDIDNMAQITPSLSGLGVLGTNSFEGDKNLTGAWQETADINLPSGTAMMWDQKTYLDMNYHMKNYNATSVLPCDFYLNIYYEPRNNNTLPMLSGIVNNTTSLGEILVPQCIQIPPKALPLNTEWRQDYNDGGNGSGGMRYMWMMAGHTHQFGTGFWVIVKDTSGAETDTIYNGQWDYANNAPLSRWDHTHPPIEYWNNGLKGVYFGTNHNGQIKGGLAANTAWVSTNQCVHFGFTTADEMQLFYYMYTTEVPAGSSALSVNTVDENPFMLTVQPNPVTGGNGKLVYVLDNTAKVSAEIIDITGKPVSRMEEETEVAGAHQVSINSDKILANGIYFARVTVDGRAYTKKFVVAQ